MNNFLPAQHTQNEIENEKGAEDDERDKIDPRQLIAHSILHLRESRERGGEQRRGEERRGGVRSGEERRGEKIGGLTREDT